MKTKNIERRSPEKRSTPQSEETEGIRRLPISRVLSWTVIHLGCMSPYTSSNLPGSSAGHACRNPIWSCSEWGLPCRGMLPPTRCALTAPFQPYRHPNPKTGTLRRYIFCCTFRRLTPPRRYLALYPVEPGLSSTPEGAATAWRSPGAHSSKRKTDYRSNAA